MRPLLTGPGGHICHFPKLILLISAWNVATSDFNDHGLDVILRISSVPECDRRPEKINSPVGINLGWGHLLVSRHLRMWQRLCEVVIFTWSALFFLLKTTLRYRLLKDSDTLWRSNLPGLHRNHPFAKTQERLCEYSVIDSGDQRIPGSSSGCIRSLHLYSPTQLDWFIKDRVVCGLPAIFEIIRKHIGIESDRSRASNPGWSRNHWASIMAPNHSESRGISPVPGFQSWLKSESLGLNYGTQPQWE
jgi:hypothetical protein